MGVFARGSQRLLLLSFGAVVALIVAARVVAIRVAHYTLDLNREITKNLVDSIELVSRMSHDVSRKNLLVQAHIFQSESVGMARVEAEIAQAERDYEASARAYEKIPKRAHVEQQAWRAFSDEVDAISRPVQSALELSRQNRDGAARSAMAALEPKFESIDRKADALIEAARRDATLDLVDVQKRENAGLALSTAVAALAAVLTAMLGLSVSRLVQRRERLLEEKNRELDAFASRVAHDLRGPLTTISLAAAKLSRSGADESASNLLGRGVSRMEAIIKDLLTLSQVGAQPAGECDPVHVAAQLYEDLTVRLREEEATLRLEIEPGRIRCADGLLRQVLWNVLDNAIKYRRPEARPEITVHGQLLRATYRLCVTDNGQGMAPEDVRHALEPFYRSPGAQDKPGTGLGLSIVKRIIEAAQGSVSIEAQPGVGTTVVMHLPLVRTASREHREPNEVAHRSPAP
jgi:signal transduction histidine kinase